MRKTCEYMLDEFSKKPGQFYDLFTASLRTQFIPVHNTGFYTHPYTDFRTVNTAKSTTKTARLTDEGSGFSALTTGTMTTTTNFIKNLVGVRSDK